jgi:ATP-binding cassette subfamily B protein
MPPDTSTDTARPAGWTTLRRFLPYLWPRNAPELRARVVISLVLVLLAKGIALSTGFVYGAAIDRMAPGAQAGVALAIGLVVAYAGARFAGVFFENVRNAIFERVGQDAARRLAESVFRHIHSLSLRYHLERRTGALTKIVERGTKSIDMMLYFLLFNIAPTAIELLVICIIFGVKFGAGLVVATLVMVTSYITFTRVITEWRSKLQRQMNEIDNQAIARAVDSLLNYETVKYFNAEEREAQRYGHAAQSFSRAAEKNETSLAALNIGQSLITNLMMAGAMAYTVWGWSRGQFSTGDVVLVNTLLAQLFRPLDMLGWVYRSIRQGLIDMEAMFGLIDTPAEVKDAEGAAELRVSAGHVRLEDVHFAYDPERPILRGIDIEVKPGAMLAVVGPSGAGKSTLSRLLFRFYEPTSGKISIDGQNIGQVNQASLRAALGIVPQDTVLFNDTIGYNIGYGKDGATQEDIEAAAKGPPILILDEATSALDSRTEAAIQATLRDVAARRTSIVIAHRLSTIVDADQIVVLDEGRVAERGTHAGLLQKGGLYAEMWNRQQTEREDQAEAAE